MQIHFINGANHFALEFQTWNCYVLLIGIKNFNIRYNMKFSICFWSEWKPKTSISSGFLQNAMQLNWDFLISMEIHAGIKHAKCQNIENGKNVYRKIGKIILLKWLLYLHEVYNVLCTSQQFLMDVTTFITGIINSTTLIVYQLSLIQT